MNFLANRATTPEKKKEVVDRLLALWLELPDLRLSQLIGNVYPCGAACNTCWQDAGHKDAYNVEDFTFINELEKKYVQLKQK
jgi:hypothetical protein